MSCVKSEKKLIFPSDILSIFVIVLSNFNFKAIQFVKLGINEVIYRSSHIASIPENKLKEITSKFKSHMDLYENHQKDLIKIENSDQLKLQNEFLTAENKKLRELLDEIINSQEIFARVLIDKDSPYLKSVVLNKGTKDKVKIGMAVIDDVYLVGQIIEVNYTNSRALLLSDLNSKLTRICTTIINQLDNLSSFSFSAVRNSFCNLSCSEFSISINSF